MVLIEYVYQNEDVFAIKSFFKTKKCQKNHPISYGMKKFVFHKSKKKNQNLVNIQGKL